MENTELKHILVAYKSTNIGLQQAHDEILRLFSVVGRSEQLPCGHKQVELVRHAAKCKDCGTVFETKW
jgi:hypothetical protein